MGDDFRAARKEQQERRAARLPVRTAEIERLSTAGYRVRRLTDYQFRVEEKLDLYPIHRRYHNIETGRRGQYRDAVAFAASVLGPATGGR
jgi:hypothetical protein